MIIKTCSLKTDYVRNNHGLMKGNVFFYAQQIGITSKIALSIQSKIHHTQTQFFI